MPAQPYSDIARAALAKTAVADLLASRPAVVLERVARGAGMTCWYYCADPGALESIVSRLRPGSCVSFFYDGRIRDVVYVPELLPELQRLTTVEHEIVFGVLADDRTTIDVDFPSGPREVAEATADLGSEAHVFFGLFPWRDNDGLDAVTINLPDADGVTRTHPH